MHKIRQSENALKYPDAESQKEKLTSLKKLWLMQKCWVSPLYSRSPQRLQSAPRLWLSLRRPLSVENLQLLIQFLSFPCPCYCHWSITVNLSRRILAVYAIPKTLETWLQTRQLNAVLFSTLWLHWDNRGALAKVAFYILHLILASWLVLAHVKPRTCACKGARSTEQSRTPVLQLSTHLYDTQTCYSFNLTYQL